MSFLEDISLPPSSCLMLISEGGLALRISIFSTSASEILSCHRIKSFASILMKLVEFTSVINFLNSPTFLLQGNSIGKEAHVLSPRTRQNIMISLHRKHEIES